jgi:hypothetical protein
MKTDVTTIFYIIKLCIQTEKDWSPVIRAVGYNSLTFSFLHVERIVLIAREYFFIKKYILSTEASDAAIFILKL